MSSIVDVLGSLRSKGVRLWSENGQLHYKAPKGALNQEEIERLRVSRGQIVALLETGIGADAAEPRREPRARLDRAPLAFSQLAHWHWYELSERCAIRQIASATRLRGRLNVDALQKSVTEIVRRHDALRTRIVVLDGVPMQEISELGDCKVSVDDLAAASESHRETEIVRIIEQHILQPIDVAVGPLFGMRLLKLRDDEHVLIVAMEHMIADEVSMNILLRELFTAYAQALQGRTFSLPAIPIQFADFAVWQRDTQKAWLENRGPYWAKRFAGCRRLRFPAVKDLSGVGWGVVPVRIAGHLKAKLREWCRLKHTTLAMSVFTAYVGFVLRWCNASESVIRYQSDGRVSPKIENTIGFFASVLYFRMKLREDDSFLDLLNQVTEEYCKAHEHADSSYMAAQVPRLEFTRNTVFNWVAQGSKIDLFHLDGSDNAITCSPIPFAHPMLKNLELDHEPGILLYDADEEVVGYVYFPLNRFSTDMMERFGRNFLGFIEALLRQPEGRVKDILFS